MNLRLKRWRQIHGGLIVSCQASAGDAFYAPAMMERFARAAEDGGAAAIRANGVADIAGIRSATRLPVLGIDKQHMEDDRILITPTFEGARALYAAGADAIALDCTARGQRFGALPRLVRIRSELRVPVMADVATLEEAQAAQAAGADFALTTMRGYTDETAHIRAFDAAVVREWVRHLEIPVIAEGRVGRPEDARAAMEAGAFAVVVGSAITRPQEITRRFVNAMRQADKQMWIAAVDLGGTNTKLALVNGAGTAVSAESVPTPATGGKEVLLDHLLKAVRRLIENGNAAGTPPAAAGVATGGWIDARTGSVKLATANLREWTGAPVEQYLREQTGLPVFVENDGIAAAAGEHRFGAGTGTRNLLCVTLGTGVGAGAVVDGKLLRGAHGLACMLGHLRVADARLLCTCGLSGCLETTVGVRVTPHPAPDELAARLADGLAAAIHILDPEMIILSGGLAAGQQTLCTLVEAALATRVLGWDRRSIRIMLSDLGALAGVRGAAAVALDRLN